MEQTFQKARSAGLPYAIESVMILVEIEDSAIIGAQRKTNYRYIYTLKGLRDIGPNEQVFQENFHNFFGKELKYWQGSAPQQPVKSPTEKEFLFNVPLSVQEGDIFSLVTGMSILETLPLAERSWRGFNFSANEYSVFYPNTEDYIAQVTIVVSSATTPLKANSEAGWRKSPLGDTKFVKPFILPAVEDGQNTVSAHFTNLEPGSVIGLRYSW